MEKGVDQLNIHSVQPGYLKILQYGYTDPRHKTNQPVEIIGPWSSGRVSPSQLGGRHSNPVVTTPMIALDFAGTTHQLASHNVAPNQQANRFHSREIRPRSRFKPLRAAQSYLNSTNSTSLLSQKGTAELTANNQLSPGSKITAASFLELKSVKNLIIQPILDTNLNLYTRIPTAETILKFYLATQALTTRVKLRTTKDAHRKAHARRRTHRHEDTAASPFFSDANSGSLMGSKRKL
ncbi:hypothetical protein F511_29574 [Dorcoceras hygrometricum]|uniref:Uncharacterized protein n=1 Tax=Dorcoceras hygrometricum TaxID=472368 RepID=A0A2Z7DE96_9LAMI|nr:hypothetical protein F511_29574 [Dorcoceras hygrometricum]